jgi:hypothetical protein
MIHNPNTVVDILADVPGPADYLVPDAEVTAGDLMSLLTIRVNHRGKA